jgi:D-3-phosphoglycerate dehydrogenase
VTWTGWYFPVLAVDPLVSAAQAKRVGVTLLSQEEVLRRADVVSVHAGLPGGVSARGATRPLLGKQELALLKPGAYLVNCARGSLIDEAALLEALDGGRLAGVALDVFSQEPVGDDALLQRLLAHERVLATPHLGASTSEAQERVAVEVARNVLSALRGDTLGGALPPSYPLPSPA